MNAAPASVATLDVLSALLEAEQNSIFRFMGEGSPYLSQATAEVRRPLNDMVAASHRHAALLSQTIEDLGGVALPRAIQLEEQYLAFLSLKFLLPKLVDAKKLAIERYENALRALAKVGDGTASAAVVDLVRGIMTEHQDHLQILQKAAAEVAQAK